MDILISVTSVATFVLAVGILIRLNQIYDKLKSTQDDQLITSIHEKVTRMIDQVKSIIK